MSGAGKQDGRADSEAGTVYMLHFDTPYKHARHYTGWTANLGARLAAHREGRGARLMEVIKDAGITWRLARTWPGTRARERAIKDRHEAPKLCPECTPHPKSATAGRSAAAAGPGHKAGAGLAAQPQREPARQVPARQPSQAPQYAPEPAPGTALPPWGSVAARELYREHSEVVDNLIGGWRQAPAPEAGLDCAEAETG